jgi:uncharacterized protein DUF6398
MNDLAALKIPVALRRRLIARLARKRSSPLERGEPRMWAAGTIYEAA